MKVPAHRRGGPERAREGVIDYLVQAARQAMPAGEYIDGRLVVPARFRIGEFWLDHVAGSSRWYIFWRDPVTRQNRKTTTTFAEDEPAQRRLAEHALDHGPGAIGEVADPAVTFLIELYLLDPENNRKHASASGSLLRALETALPGVTVSTLTRRAQKSLLDALRAGPSRGPLEVNSIRNCMILLRAAVLRACRPDDDEMVLCRQHPPSFIAEDKEIAKHLGLPEPVSRKWSPPLDLLAAVLREVADDEALRRWLVLAIGFGGRVAATAEATASQLNLEWRLFNLNPDDRTQEPMKWRAKVPVAPSLMAELSCWPEERWIDDVPVNLRGRLKRAADRVQPGMGIRFVPRCMRHFMGKAFRTAYVDYGIPHVDKEQRKLFMGHQRPDISDRYGEYDPAFLLLARNAVECILHDLDERSGGVVFRNACRAGTLPPGPVVVEPQELGRAARAARLARAAGARQPSPAKSRAARRAPEGDKVTARPIHDLAGAHVIPPDFVGLAAVSRETTGQIGSRQGELSQVQSSRSGTFDEASEPSSPEVPVSPGRLGGFPGGVMDLDLVEAGKPVVIGGVKGSFRPIPFKPAMHLDEAFERRPSDILRPDNRRLHFVPTEGGPTEEQIIVVIGARRQGGRTAP